MPNLIKNLPHTEGENGILYPIIEAYEPDTPEELKQPLGWIGRMILAKMEEENPNQAFQMRKEMTLHPYIKKKELEALDRINNLMGRILEKTPPSEIDMLQRIRDFEMARQRAKELVLHEYQ